MDKVTFLDVMQIDGTSKSFAIIEHDDGSQTSMPKADYDTLASESDATPTA